MDKKKRILLVDDDILVIKTIRRLLVQEGYEITEARSGEQATKFLEDDLFDLVVSDIRMPGVGGIQAIEKIRQQEQNKNHQTPVILITGYASEEAPVDAFRLGVADYILKPFNNDALLSSIKKVLEGCGNLNNEITHLLSDLDRLVRQYQVEHEREIFNNLGLRQFFKRLSDLVFSIEKRILGS